MIGFLKDIFNNFNLFDLFFFVVLLYSVIQCFLKGFFLSLISIVYYTYNRFYRKDLYKKETLI